MIKIPVHFCTFHKIQGSDSLQVWSVVDQCCTQSQWFCFNLSKPPWTGAKIPAHFYTVPEKSDYGLVQICSVVDQCCTQSQQLRFHLSKLPWTLIKIPVRCYTVLHNLWKYGSRQVIMHMQPKHWFLAYPASHLCHSWLCLSLENWQINVRFQLVHKRNRYWARQ